MKSAWAVPTAGTMFAVFTALGISVSQAWAQAPSSPSPSTAPPGGAAAGGVIVVVVMLALIALLGVAVKVSDVKRRRTDAGVALQGRIADALLADASLGSLPIAVTIHTPFWSRSPVTIEARGPVPSPALREAAMALVMREAFNSGLQFRVEDRLAVDPAMSRAAA